jgi:hypothetical protein
MVLFRPHTSSTARGADPARTSGSASSRRFPCVLPTAGRGITPGALSEEPSPRRGVAEGQFVYKAPSAFGWQLTNGGAAHSVCPPLCLLSPFAAEATVGQTFATRIPAHFVVAS